MDLDPEKLSIQEKHQIVEKHKRLLTAGIWSNIMINYDDTIRHRGRTYPFVIYRLEPVQVGGVDFDSVYSFNNRRSSQHIRNMGSVFLKKVKEQIQAQKF